MSEDPAALAEQLEVARRALEVCRCIDSQAAAAPSGSLSVT